MKWNNVKQALVFLSLAGPGIVGNILVFMRHVYTSALGTEKRQIDLLLIHLAFSNLIIICSTGITDIATVFYFRNFLGDIGCKAGTFLVRMAWGLSSASLVSSVWSRLSPSVPGSHFGQSSNYKHYGRFFPFSFFLDC